MTQANLLKEMDPIFYRGIDDDERSKHEDFIRKISELVDVYRRKLDRTPTENQQNNFTNQRRIEHPAE